MIHIIDEQIILDYWCKFLWTNKNFKVQNQSSMLYLGGYDINIYKLYQPIFYAYIENNMIVGVNSGHKTCDKSYRSRGLWVDEKYRNKGIAKKLLCFLDQQAKNQNCEYLWSIPRKTALSVYIRSGYTQTSSFFNKNMVYGPNCYVKKEIFLF